jgi:23S rRNA (pseudouridine1915-N3)-methyltransferase
MKITLICVGRPAPVYQDAIAEYEARARRYWSFDAIEIKADRAGRNTSEQAIRDAEAARIMKRVPAGAELVALSRTGDAWSSERLAHHLESAGVHGGPDIAFIIGGALGLGETVMKEAKRRMRLSTFTMPHDLARLVLVEQIYRAGTLVRGEPYHKGTAGS